MKYITILKDQKSSCVDVMEFDTLNEAENQVSLWNEMIRDGVYENYTTSIEYDTNR